MNSYRGYDYERYAGTIDAIGRQVDPIARTLTARIRLQNGDGHLRHPDHDRTAVMRDTDDALAHLHALHVRPTLWRLPWGRPAPWTAGLADRNDLYEKPMHPYTKALLSAIPIPDPVLEEKRQRIILEGDVPSPINPPSGCHFRTRCPLAQEICKEEQPFVEHRPHHWAACHFAEKSMEVLPDLRETTA